MAEVAAFAHPVTHCIALICSMSIDLWMGEFTRARETLPILRDCVRANTLAPYIAVAQGFEGERALEFGRHAEAVEALPSRCHCDAQILRVAQPHRAYPGFACLPGMTGSGKKSPFRLVRRSVVYPCCRAIRSAALQSPQAFIGMLT
ncbi:hypothetical protein [Novosphingobium sp. HR1a]|uniref:Uncharacterized protein n=1 Tax=Novosphingobium resinovorum TaxID=158500 RepID=A0A1D7ZZP8_9SPHN|nr:hypothetical protein [Novosphingobium sp. HR1a]AOR75336.1 hypothetical protein BES08_00105 [Novosphingobium resinovorum]